jgi:hypothetical protein
MDARAREYFENMSTSISASLRIQWEQEITNAEHNRMDNPAAMDILGTSTKPSGKEQDNAPSIQYSDVEEWIQMAIDNEKMQCVAILFCCGGN